MIWDWTVPLISYLPCLSPAHWYFLFLFPISCFWSRCAPHVKCRSAFSFKVYLSMEMQCREFHTADDNSFDVCEKQKMVQICRWDLHVAQGCLIITCLASSCWFTWSVCLCVSGACAWALVTPNHCWWELICALTPDTKLDLGSIWINCRINL